MRRTDLQLQISVALQRKKSPHFKNQIQKASAKFTLLATVLHKPSRGKLKISQHIKNPSEGVKELTRQWRFAGLRSRTGGQCRKEGPAFFLTIFLLEVQAYLNFLYFSLLQSTDIVLFFSFFYKLKIYGSPALSELVSTIFQTAFAHFESPVTFW